MDIFLKKSQMSSLKMLTVQYCGTQNYIKQICTLSVTICGFWLFLIFYFLFSKTFSQQKRNCNEIRKSHCEEVTLAAYLVVLSIRSHLKHIFIRLHLHLRCEIWVSEPNIRWVSVRSTYTDQVEDILWTRKSNIGVELHSIFHPWIISQFKFQNVCVAAKICEITHGFW